MQQTVRKFMRDHGLSHDLAIRYIDLTSEVGELGKEVLKCTDYGKREPIVSPALLEEIGDCLFSLLCACNAVGIDADAAISQAIRKYEARLRAKGSVESGRYRYEAIPILYTIIPRFRP